MRYPIKQEVLYYLRSKHRSLKSVAQATVGCLELLLPTMGGKIARAHHRICKREYPQLQFTYKLKKAFRNLFWQELVILGRGRDLLRFSWTILRRPDHQVWICVSSFCCDTGRFCDTVSFGNPFRAFGYTSWDHMSRYGDGPSDWYLMTDAEIREELEYESVSFHNVPWINQV